MDIQKDISASDVNGDRAVPKQLDHYLQVWEECRERGQPISAAELCQDWPAGQAQVERLIALLEACDRLLIVGDTVVENREKDASPLPPVAAGYQLRDELGRGGMGVVYRAWDPVLRREVALKMLRPSDYPATPEQAAQLARRFEQEAQVLARLKHEHIVSVFEARMDHGRPYFVMECVRGGSLAAKREEITKAGPDVIVPLLEKVARAVHHAHSQDVLHRDLKPANILLEPSDKPGQSPVPRVGDFGLAKLLRIPRQTEPALEASALPTGSSDTLADASALTTPGVEPGTPAYMAPEQFDSALGTIGSATDVWALGVILYELLTGQKPFTAATRMSLAEHICRQSPPRPRSLQPELDRKLEIIVLRCLEKRPEDRFASAAELADALARYHRAKQRRPWLLNALLGLTMLSLIVWVMLREMSPLRRYERRVESLIEQLKRGEPVELIQPGGRPPPFRIRCGEGVTQVQMTPEGLVVSSKLLSMVELLPKVPVSRYRLVAEIRHDHHGDFPIQSGEVILTFAGQHAPSPFGVHHVVAGVSLDDWDPYAANPAEALLKLMWYLEPPPDGMMPPKRHYCFPNQYKVQYNRTTPREAMLHTLTLEAAPEAVFAVLGDCPEKRMGPLTPDLFTYLSRSLPNDHEEARGAALGPLNQPAIGLVVDASQCTIRRLQITPLLDTNP